MFSWSSATHLHMLWQNHASPAAATLSQGDSSSGKFQQHDRNSARHLDQQWRLHLGQAATQPAIWTSSGVSILVRLHQTRQPGASESLLFFLDPYLNTDAGIMFPFEDGEVFISDDGGKVGIFFVARHVLWNGWHGKNNKISGFFF